MEKLMHQPFVHAKAKPVVTEQKEQAEPSRWMERAEYTGFGAAGMGVLWRG